MSKTAPSRAGNPQGHLRESSPVAQLAPVTPIAPVPPQNLEAEESVLGAMMISPGAIGAVSEIARLGWERPGDAVELVDRAEGVIFDLSQQRVTTEFSHIETLLKESFERITALYEAGADVTGTPSGFRDLDRITSGFQPGSLIIVAARPSMGKSAPVLCMAAHLAARN